MLKMIVAMIVLSQVVTLSQGCGIAVYWGHNKTEGSLQDACSTALYNYVILSSVSTFGLRQNPVLDLADHCDPLSGGCQTLAPQIKACQAKGIKVLLSLGGPVGLYAVASKQDALDIADIIYYAYLNGGSSGPLGDVVLDGVDLDIRVPGTADHWDDLTMALSGLYKPDGERFLLSASTGCGYPDPYLNAAIRTGLFDYVWVRYYDDVSCDYTSGLDGVVPSWRRWKSGVPRGSELFFGVAANSEAVESGYVDPDTLTGRVMGLIRIGTPNYGGIMVWNRYYDVEANYTSRVFSAVCSVRHSAFISQVV